MCNNLFCTVFLDEPPDYEVYSVNLKQNIINKDKSVLNSITFCLEGQDHKEINFNVETLTFTLQLFLV